MRKVHLFPQGGGPMPCYRLYHVERDHFAGVDYFDAENAVEAVPCGNAQRNRVAELGSASGR
jgi:hypothetical protein